MVTFIYDMLFICESNNWKIPFRRQSIVYQFRDRDAIDIICILHILYTITINIYIYIVNE